MSLTSLAVRRWPQPQIRPKIWSQDHFSRYTDGFCRPTTARARSDRGIKGLTDLFFYIDAKMRPIIFVTDEIIVA